MIVFLITLFVNALGFEFAVGDTLEVLVTGALLVGVLGIAAGIAWFVGQAVESLTRDL